MAMGEQGERQGDLMVSWSEMPRARHGRYITFQMAEVAIPRPLFAEILHLIDGLRPAPLPP